MLEIFNIYYYNEAHDLHRILLDTYLTLGYQAKTVSGTSVYCTVLTPPLHYTAPHLYNTTLHCTTPTVHYTVPHLYNTTLHCTTPTLHYTVPHLQYTTLYHTSTTLTLKNKKINATPPPNTTI